jgi:hypothetical protein
MSTITFKYTQPDAELTLQRAKELGYKEQVMDESQLLDGKIPVVQLTKEDGTLRWEEDFTYNDETLEIETQEFRLDGYGNKIPVMGQKDIKIDNPQTPEEFVAVKAQEVVAELLAGGIEKVIVGEAQIQANEILATAKATAKATKKAVAASIEVTIE